MSFRETSRARGRDLSTASCYENAYPLRYDPLVENSYIAVVFDTDDQAEKALHRLWAMGSDNKLDVRGALVLRRRTDGTVEVAHQETDVGRRTLIATAAGMLIAAVVGGPVVATVELGGIGGAIAGIAADVRRRHEWEQASHEASLSVPDGHAALVAEISERWVDDLDGAMRALGGTVYRRPAADVRGDTRDSSYFSDMLLPYDYQPRFTPDR